HRVDQLERLGGLFDQMLVGRQHQGQPAGALHGFDVAEWQQRGLLVPDAPGGALEGGADADHGTPHAPHHRINADRVAVSDEERRPMSEPVTQRQTVTARTVEGVASIELNRPEALNAWNVQLGTDLLAAVREAAEDGEARAVVITGAGRAFSSGADLKDISGGDTTPDGRPDVYK